MNKNRIKRSLLLGAAVFSSGALFGASYLNLSLGEESGYAKLEAAGCGMNFAGIGAAGNALPDSSRNYDRGWGRVDTTYGMGATQVTWAQLVVFLNDSGIGGNAAMFSSTTASPYIPIWNDSGVIKMRVYQEVAADNAVCYLKYAEAVAFANWLGTGDVDVSGVFSLPTVDEWYKAAYYDPNQGGAGVEGYWKFGTSTDSVTFGDAYTEGDVFGGYMSIAPNSEAWPDADFGTENVWGLYGMSGGLEDWTSTAQDANGTKHWALGGNYSTSENYLSDAATNYRIASSIPGKTGFRLAVDVRAALTAVETSEVRDGAGGDSIRLVIAPETLDGFSISDGATLTFANGARLENSYPADAEEVIPPVTQGGSVVFVAEGSAFVAVPATDDGTGKIVFSNNSMTGATTDAAGGALFNSTNGSVELRNVEFSGNSVAGAKAGDGLGGAIYNKGWVRIDNGSFDGNTAIGGSTDAVPGAGKGGAIFNDYGSTTVLSNVSFTDNTASSGKNNYFAGGGAIFNRGNLTISDATFEGNQLLGTQTSSAGGGAIANQGGQAVLTDVVFKNNSSVNDGGAICSSTVSPNGADYYKGSLEVTRGTFEGNSATATGGAIANGNSELLVVRDGTFTNNIAGTGGAIFSAHSQISDSTFTGNVANKVQALPMPIGPRPLGMGGALMIGPGQDDEALTSTLTDNDFTGNSANYRGGAIWMTSTTVNITGGTFSGNSSGLGGAIYALGGSKKGGRLSVTDVVFINNTSTESVSGAGGALALEGNVAATIAVSSGKTLAYTGNAAAKGGFLYLNGTGDGNPSATFTIGDGAKLTIGAANAVDAALDSISSSNANASIVKNGEGKLVLNADNSGFLGTFDVEAGTLVIGEGTASAKLGGNVIIHAGATLCGVGELTGTTTILAGGSLNPGNSPGVLTFENLTLEAGSVITIEAGDQIVISGVLDLSGISAGEQVTFDLSGFDASSGNALFIVFDQVNGLAAGSSLEDYLSFVGLDAGQGVSFGSNGVSVIPEPATYALWAGAALAGLALLRRRKN